jgi:hypothetical protein
MSTYQIALRSSAALFNRLEFGALRRAFWNWWIGLYAEAPRKLPPML